MWIARTGMGGRRRHLYYQIYGSAFHGISASSKVSFGVSKHLGEPNEYEKVYSRWGPHMYELRASFVV